MSTPAARVARVVLDSNVLLRTLFKKTGPSARLLDAALDGEFRLVLSPAIVGEVRRGFFKPHVRRRYPLSLEEISDFLAILQVAAEFVPGRLEVHSGSRDPKDNMVLACALEGHAAYLVTDDREDLLPLKQYHGVQIVSVPGFLRILESH